MQGPGPWASAPPASRAAPSSERADAGAGANGVAHPARSAELAELAVMEELRGIKDEPLEGGKPASPTGEPVTLPNQFLAALMGHAGPVTAPDHATRTGTHLVAKAVSGVPGQVGRGHSFGGLTSALSCDWGRVPPGCVAGGGGESEEGEGGPGSALLGGRQSDGGGGGGRRGLRAARRPPSLALCSAEASSTVRQSSVIPALACL